MKADTVKTSYMPWNRAVIVSPSRVEPTGMVRSLDRVLAAMVAAFSTYDCVLCSDTSMALPFAWVRL